MENKLKPYLSHEDRKTQKLVERIEKARAFRLSATGADKKIKLDDNGDDNGEE